MEEQTQDPITHFVFDTETLGLKDDAVILSIGVVPFTFESNATYEELVENGIHLKLAVGPQITAGRKIDKKTMQWWKGQGDEAKWILEPSDDDIHPLNSLKIIAGFIRARGQNIEKSWMWSRGNAFDFGKIEHLYDQYEISMPFVSFMERDIRTMVDCYCGTHRGKIEATRPQTGFVKHSALHDAASDAAKMIEIYQAMLAD